MVGPGVTYSDKFEASQNRAHLQLVATKILKELGDLQAKVANSPTAPRRWVWELIQNAKDVHPDGGVRIRLEFKPDADEPHVTFRHTGRPFTADDIRFLIEQISTKERSRTDEGKPKTTGKFGTGFLTTHLLSETVYIAGVAKEPDEDFRRFEITLDRSSKTPEGLIAAIQQTKSSLKNLDELPPFDHIEGEYNTEFTYPLIDSMSREIAHAGIKDLTNCLPYSLVFVDEIDSVEVAPARCFFRARKSHRRLSDRLSLVSTTTKDGDTQTTFMVARLTTKFTSIVVPVKEEHGSITILPIPDDVPRLFCDFPLLGTEEFPFPAVINNPTFNPTDPRDGVFLAPNRGRPHAQSEVNKQLIQDAIRLYIHLLNHATSDEWKNLHLLAQIPRGYASASVDSKWLTERVKQPIIKRLRRASIVTTSTGELEAMLRDKDEPFMWFPDAETKELRERLWQCANSWFPKRLPQNSDVELWYKLTWRQHKLTIDNLAELVESQATLTTLKNALVEGGKVYAWLNDFYALLREDKQYDAIINKRLIFPNQNGDFCKKADLYRDAGDINSEFKEILYLLGRDLRAELVADKVDEEFEASKQRDRAFTVKEIASIVNEKTNDRTVAKRFGPAFKKLLLYFSSKPSEAKSLFPSLYAHRHRLYDDDEILENIDKAEKLDGLFSDFKVNDVAALRVLIERGTGTKNGLLPVTQDIIVSMGITSVEDWIEALKDKDLETLFAHESTPTLDMFVYAHSLFLPFI